VFTTGSKLLVGASVLSLIGTILYGMVHGGPLGTLGLVSATVALMMLAGINFWVRDSNVSSMDTPGIARSAAAHSAPSNSMWPLIGGLGAIVLAIGFVVGQAITWLGLIILLATVFEWMIQAWSERASGDAKYNASVRQRILHPIEFPVLAALGLGLIIFSFSRIVLYLPSTAGAIAFGGVAMVVLLFGALIAAKRSVGRAVVTSLCAVGAVGIIGAGVASAVSGGREIEKHELATYEEGNCGNEESEADHHASQALAMKSNLAATVTLQDGKLFANVLGINGPQSSVTLARSNPSLILFKNLDAENHRLLVDLGLEVKNAGAENEQKIELKSCTQEVRQDGVQFLVIKPKLPSFAAQTPYSFSVPGVDGASLEIVVP
jgi:hypothetical protein